MAGPSFKRANNEYNRAIECLQVDTKILPDGVAQAGAWNYSFIYDLVSNQLPKLPEISREISEKRARTKLVEVFFKAMGCSTREYLDKFFGWPKASMQASIDQLTKEQFIHLCRSYYQGNDPYCIPELLSK
jgi:uncharacterized protein YcaQ